MKVSTGIRKLRALQKDKSDPEIAHKEADRILLAMLDDLTDEGDKITRAFNGVLKWYA